MSSVASKPKIRVAYFGRKGSYSHQVALSQLSSDAAYIACPTSQQVVEALLTGAANRGVLPIENSISGMIPESIDAIVSRDFVSSGFRIQEQWHVPIQLSLIGNSPMSRIKTIYSHPFPLAYLQKWLDRHFPNAERIETVSTTEGAYLASRRKGSAAIASAKAAPIYRLKVLKPKLSDPKKYQTRFYLLAKSELRDSKLNQVALCFSLPNRSGALVGALQVFARHRLNMTRIMSRPLAKRTGIFNPDEYLFWVDLECDPRNPRFRKMLGELGRKTKHYDILGLYRTRVVRLAR
jgi:chorismate mutase / prephenate dehydratase